MGYNHKHISTFLKGKVTGCEGQHSFFNMLRWMRIFTMLIAFCLVRFSGAIKLSCARLAHSAE
jgi:hypothetical protein